ncbi:MAG: hypothetical protein M0R49_13660, partial [Limnochordia bacterium]|nr:hypothetical protein [Limnochordia bacterium]
MRLKHMPCGVHHFADYGYQRYPYQPVLGDDVTVQVLVEDASGPVHATLRWEEDGAPMPDIVGCQFHRSGDDRLYVAFELGTIEHVGTVRYHILVQDDQETLCTKPYSFDLLDVEGLGELQDLIEGDHGTYAVFKR